MWALAIYWVCFYTLHSLLAHKGIKCRIQHTVPWLREPRYRLFYNVLATVTLVLLLWLHVRTPAISLWQQGWVLEVAGVLLMVAGGLLLLAAFRNYRLAPFLGLVADKDEPLQISGLNRYMRHPIYTAVITLFTGLCILQPLTTHLLAWLITLVYVWLGSRLEERKLIQQYGAVYADYQRRVKRFVPFIWMLLLILHINQYPL